MYRTLHKQKRENALDLVLELKNLVRNSNKNPDEFVYILPWGNYGEHTYIMGYLPVVRERYKVCLVLQESKFWLSRHFQKSYDFLISIPDTLSSLYENLYDMSYLRPGFPFVVWTDLIYNGRLNYDLVRQRRLTLAESYAFALEIPLDSQLTPCHARPREEQGSRSQQQYCLLMTDANTITKLPDVFWNCVYKQLDSHGLSPIFDVTTRELNFSGIADEIRTIKLLKDDLIDFVIEKCTAIVGLRSGMLDLLAGIVACMSHRKLISVFPIDSDEYSCEMPAHNWKGVSKAFGINTIYKSRSIIDVEVDLRKGDYIESVVNIVELLKNNGSPTGC
jgi:hypothetical protein